MSVGQTLNKGTDRDRKSRAICNCRGTARRTCETREAGRDRSTGRRRCGRQTCSIVERGAQRGAKGAKPPAEVHIEKSRNRIYTIEYTLVSGRFKSDSRTAVITNKTLSGKPDANRAESLIYFFSSASWAFGHAP